MSRAVYPGSFDPPTYGHLDIIERASRSFEALKVVVFENVQKDPMFTVEERVSLLKDACAHLPNVEVESSYGLLVDYACANDINIVVKGLRAVSDFDFEFKMALMNKKLAPEIETVFMITSLKYLYLSSSLVKEVAYYGGCIQELVPPQVAKKVFARVQAEKNSKTSKGV